MVFPSPTVEQRRLQVLNRYAILDTPPERTFDRIVNLCVQIFKVPMASVSLVDHNRQWHKACYGIDERELSREVSFCAHAILTDSVTVIPDATLDPRFATNPLVTGAPHVRFYAGAPLRVASGENLGTLCIIDTVPRELTESEQTILAELADVVVDELELRLAISERQAAIAARYESEERFHSAFKDSAIGMALIGRDGQWLQVNRALCGIVGYTPDELLATNFQAITHPDDLAADLGYLRQVLANDISSYEMEKRYFHQTGRVVWALLSVSVVRNETGYILYFIAQVQDITERKQAQAALQATQARLQHLLTVTPTVIYSCDVDEGFRATFVSDNVMVQTGYQAEAFVENVDLWQTRLHPDDALWLKHDNRALLEPGPHTREYRFRHKNGQYRWIHDIATMVAGTDGNCEIVGSWLDVTERKQAEAALKESEARYRIVAETANDVIMTIDEQSTILYVNRAAEKVFGYQPSELVGQSIMMLMPEQFRTLHTTGIQRYLDTGRRQIAWEAVEVSGLHRDGKLLTLEVSFGEYSAITEHSFTAIVRDVSERKRTQEALRRSETRFRTVVESLGEGLLITDLNDVILYANSRVAQLTGYSVDELLGQVAFKLLLPTESWSDLLSRHEQRKRAIAERYETQLRHSDGSMLWIEVNATPYYGADGEIIGTLGALTDISERKQTAQELQRAKDQAEEANRAKSEFLSRMSHELRTPLNAILGFAQLMQLNPLAPEENESIEYIIKAGRHLLALINDVLDISRIETGTLIFSMESLNVAAAVRSAFEIVTPLATESQVQLIHQPSCHDWFVLADQHRFQQMLINLISNAIKYNRKQGVVHVSYCAIAENRLRLNVRDTGWGIASEKLARLFTTFDRLGAEQTTVEGTGIGLALTKWLVQAMGGRIGVESEAGQGSTFWVEFPLISKSTGAVPQLAIAAQRETVGTQRKATVLYIEDNFSNLRLVERLLAKYSDYHLITATDGVTGLAVAEKEQPDVILLDLHLPDMVGAEVLGHLQRHATLRTIPVIVLSADAMPEQVDGLMSTGVAAYLTKPLDVPAFLECLTTTVKEHIAG